MRVGNNQHQRRGIVNVWVIFTMFLMIGLIGWACDAGYSTLVMNQLQAAADAAALAGAQKVKVNQDQARIQAQALALANKAATLPLHIDQNTGNGAGGDVVLGVYDKQTNVFTPSVNGPNAVKVVANRTASGIDGAVNLIFGPMFGANTVELSASAIAIAQGVSNAAIIVLHPSDDCALNLQGNPTLNVTGGAIQVNSNNPNAACGGGSLSISAPELNVVGGTTVNLQNGGSVNTGSTFVPDPLAALPAPANGPVQPSASGGTTMTIQPGYYPGGIARSGNGNLTMQPGVYVLDGTFSKTGNGNITGHQVMIYMKSGGLDWRGNGQIDVDPPTSGVYAGVTIFQARNNLSDSQINGTAGSDMLGTIDIPGPPAPQTPPLTEHPNLDLRGDANALGNQVIAWHMTLGGGSTINIPYNGAFPPGNSVVYLVQ